MKEKAEKVEIKDIRSKHIGKKLEIIGVVDYSSEIRPRAISIKFECPKCNSILDKEQKGETLKSPRSCKCGFGIEEYEFFKELSTEFEDYQRIVLTEVAKDNTKKLAVYLSGDLCSLEKAKSTSKGHVVKVIGKLEEIHVDTSSGQTSRRFDWRLIAEKLDEIGEINEEA